MMFMVWSFAAMLLRLEANDFAKMKRESWGHYAFLFQMLFYIPIEIIC